MSERDHYAAVKAMLEAGNAHPRTLAEVKSERAAGTLPFAYTVLYVTERYTEPAHVDDWSSTRAWRIQARAVGTTEDLARQVRENARLALEDRTITVGGRPGAIGRAVSHEPIEEDSDGRYSGLSEYGYAL